MAKSRTTLPGWSDLPRDVLLSVFKRLSTIQTLGFRDVCTSWCLVAKTYFCKNWPLCNPLIRRPLLLLPSPTSDDEEGEGEGEGEGEDDYTYSDFMDLAEQNFFKPKNMARKCGKSKCIGTSRGWLLCLDEGRFPYLYNPFLDLSIRPRFLYPLPFITKAILWGDPIHSDYNYGIVVMHGCYFQSKLAFTKCGDLEWTDLKGSHGPYCDIICSEDNSSVYALGDLGSVESWDFTTSFPTKKLNLLPVFPPERVAFETQMGDYRLYSTNSYLVESQGDLLIVIRYIGNFVREDTGDVIEEEAIHEFPNAGFVLPYRTKAFQVYKLNLAEKKWKVLESLGDRMLFLGGNQSLSLSAKDMSRYKKNLIFFTDDSWDRMNEHYQYGGHDIGTYNFEDGCFVSGYLRRIQPPPFWLFPTECESSVSFEE